MVYCQELNWMKRTGLQSEAANPPFYLA